MTLDLQTPLLIEPYLPTEQRTSSDETLKSESVDASIKE
jgi:hypothetical protein